MIELVRDMSFCMIPSLLIGGGMGWILSKIVKEKKRVMEIEILEKTLKERDKQFNTLKSNYANQQIKLNKLTDEGIVARHQLLQKSNFLRKTSDELYKAQNRLRQLEAFEEELSHFETVLAEKNKMIEELEQVLIKADDLISEEEPSSVFDHEKEHTLLKEIERLTCEVEKKNDQIKRYEQEQQTISEESFLISRDQFKEIEKRLKEYQERIKILREENRQLAGRQQKVQKNRGKLFNRMGRFLFNGKDTVQKSILEINPLKKQQELKKI